MALIDRIKFDAEGNDEIVWKFPSQDLKLGAQLIVNETQEAVFVKNGQVLDVFGAGRHTLSTSNIPILNKLINLPFGGETPFSAEVWFINRTARRDMKWGTKTPISLVDAKFNVPVDIRSFGQWGFRIDDSRSFLRQLIGTLSAMNSLSVREHFIAVILQNFQSVLASSMIANSVSFYQVSALLADIAGRVRETLIAEFGGYGIELLNFNIESISIPDEAKKRIEDVMAKRMEIEQLSSIQVGQGYVAARTFEVLNAVAENPNSAAGNMMGSGLGLGIGLGAGFPLGAQIGSQMQVPQPAPPQTAPATAQPSVEERLKKLKSLFDAGVISEVDYNQKKQEILSEL